MLQIRAGYDQARLLAKFWSPEADNIRFAWEKPNGFTSEEDLDAFINEMKTLRPD